MLDKFFYKPVYYTTYLKQADNIANFVTDS